MKLTFRRREVSDLQHLRTLVSDNVDAMEPGLTILASNLNLGRTNVELAALDSQNCPMLFVLGLTADDAMLVRALEAYAWCLDYAEANGNTGFYLDRVDWAAGASRAGEAPAPRPKRLERHEAPVVEEPIAPPAEPRVAPREEPRLVLLRDELRHDDRSEREEPAE